MSLLGRIGHDIAHPFGIGNGPVRTPAPQQQAQRQVIQTPAPGQQPQHFSQVAQQRIMARNPSMGAQQIARGPVMPNMNNMPHFNAFTAAPGAAFDSVKGLGNAFVNTAQVPYSAARVAGANITGNKKALQNAHKALASDTSNNIAWNDAYRQTANELAGAAYAPTYNKRITQSNNQAGATIAKAYGNTPRAKLYGSLVAEAGKNQDLNRYLNDVGLTQDTSRLATGLRLGTPIVSAGAQTALQATGIGAGGQIAKEAAAQAAGKMTAKQIAKQAESKLVKNALGYGAANAGISTLAPIAAGDTNAADYAKAVTIGALSGMALPVLGAGVGKLAGTKAGQEVANALTAKTNALKTLPKLPNPANALKKAANLPESVAHEHLNATDPYYAGYQDQINTLNQAHARNAANGMAPGHPTQVQLQKSMNQLGAKTADMRKAVLQNTRDKLLMRGDPAVAQGGYVQLPGGKNDPLKALREEAAKHKNADDFINSMKQENPDYVDSSVVQNHALLNKSIHNVPLKDISEYQRNAAASAARYRTHSGSTDVSGKPVTLRVERDGTVSIADGNHRIAQAMKNGDDNINAIFENDKVPAKFGKGVTLKELHSQAHPSEPGAASTQQQLAQINRKLEAFKGERTPGYDSLVRQRDELVGKSQPQKLYHATTQENADSIAKNGFEARAGSNTRNSNTGEPGVWLSGDRNVAEEFSRGSHMGGKGVVMDTEVHGKLYKATDASNLPTSKYTSPEKIAELKKQGYVGVEGQEMFMQDGVGIVKNPVTYIFDPKAIKPTTKKSLTEKLGIKKLDQSGHASGDSPLMPFNKPIANAAEKLRGKKAPLEPQAARPVQKKIVSSEGSIAPDSLASLKKEALKHDNPSIFATTVLRSDMPVPKDFIDFSRTNESDGRAKLESLYNQAHAEAKTGTAPSTKPALPKQPAVVPRRNPLPKVSGEKPVGVSSPKTTPNNMTADSYARTFGVGKAQAAKDIAEASKAPKTKPIPKQKPAPATAAENTARNPVKVNIPTVEAGNFEQARINPQLASHPVQFATGQLLSKAKRLGLDTSTFGKMVEGTIESSTQAEADAVKAYRDLTDRVHATSQSLGGNTPYVNNYFRHEWDLSDPEKRVEFNKMAEKLKTKGKADNPFAFEGLDRQPRVFKTIAQGEALGFKLKNQNLADEIKDYGSGSAHALRQQALSKALTEADMNAETKPHTFDLGGGKNVLLSDEGMKQAKGYAKNMASDNVGVKAYRKSNRGFKQILLSVSQFHPINISVLRASPTLAAEGHGLRAAKGIFDTFAAQASPKYSEKLQAAALRDGTIEDSARMGTPIKFGSDYKTEGQIGFGKGGLGEKAIFERAMPAEHIQMVKAAKQDLQEKGLSLDSPEAHALGTRINEIMGFVNTEARNLDKGTQRRLGDIFLAPQFTRSKWATNKAAVSTGGLAGSYARSAVVANAAASAFVAMGVGYALHQKSDNLNDLLLRAVFHPSVPTPLKDKKGNTIEFGLPATQSSEVLGLLGFSLKRGTDQHLHVDWKGGNVPSNVANYGRSRLAVVPANALKVATNTDYAGKPLYDPNATAKTKLEQGATTVSTGLLPIGGQGIAQTKLVKSHLPSGVQQVLNANTPGTNPMLKSAAASFGLTPRTDKTVGKGQQTTQYFDALNGASKGLNSQEKAALTMVTGSKKNPVTGKYDVAPTSDDSRAKATALLQNPKVIDHLIAMNQTLKKQGQAVDPLFTASKDQITKYYQYQAMPPGSADKTDWMNKNKDWYRPVADARNSFFNSLPAGDPNKPKSPIQYPSASPAVANLQSQYDTLTDSKAKGNFIADHPELLAQWNKQSQYTNKMRTAQGYAALKDSPQAAPALQKYMDSYNAADKATRKSIRNSNPTAYQSMIAYYDSVDLYNLNKQGAVNQLQGEPDQNSKQNKAIQGLARDIYQNADGTYGIVPAGWMDGLSNGSGSSGGYGSGSKGGKKSKGLTAISNSKVSYAGLSKANRGSYGKFKVGGSSKVGSSTVKLASYKAPKANVIKKPKGVLA